MKHARPYSVVREKIAAARSDNAPRHRKSMLRAPLRAWVSPRHKDLTVSPDSTPRARCEAPFPGMHRVPCPLHSPTAYADQMARHAAGYDGSYDGPGSSL